MEVEVGHGSSEVVEAGSAQHHPVPEGSEPLGRRRQRRRVLVDAEDREVRVGGEQGVGVSASAEGRVDHRARGHGPEQLDDAVPQDRHVPEGHLVVLGYVGQSASSGGGRATAEPPAHG